MTTLVWLAGASLVWGAMVWGAAMALQSGNDLSGRARQWIWRAVALLLIAPWMAAPFAGSLTEQMGVAPAPVVIVVGGAGTEAMVETAPVANVAVAEEVVAAPGIELPWIELIAAAIAMGWLVRMGAALLAARRLRMIVRTGRSVAEGPAHMALVRWANRLEVRKRPELCVVSANISPFSTGAARPMICVPQDIERDMHAEALDLVIGHECIHVARGDGWLRPVERVIADVLWFNPFAWAIRRELDLARELACDEAVVELSSARKAYARTLRDVAGLAAGLPRSAPAASMSISGGGRIVAMRMKRTLDAAARRPGKAALVGAAMLAIAGAPMAIAQAVLIDAMQPPEVPVAPLAPPAPPSARALALAPRPPAAPRAPDHVFTSDDGLIRVSFPAKVISAAGSAAQGYEVELLQTPRGAGEEICSAKLSGLSSLRVAKDQLVAKGDAVGSESDSMRFAVTCSDEIDANGRPIAAAPPAPPPPPIAPTGTLRAPLAPAPAPLAAPSPTALPAPLAPATPLTPATPQVAPAPLVAPTPSVTPTPPAAPRPEPVQFTSDTSAPVISSIVVEGNNRVDTQAIVNRLLVRPGDQLSQEKLQGSVRGLIATGLFGDVRFHMRGAELHVVVIEKDDTWKLEGATKAVLAEPARFTSGYGYRADPWTKEMVFHEGVDIAAAKGTPVRSPGAGVVAFAGLRGDSGNVVEVVLDGNYRVRFGHLNEISVVQGEALDAGDVVGTIGSSGQAAGAHLHLEFYRNGRSLDPQTVQGLTLITGR